jgi:hypothetical protein
MPGNCSATQEDVGFDVLKAGSQLSSPPISVVFFLLGFDLEDGGDVFLRNVGLPPNYTALQT